ncbi:hypothetical protein N665_0179s0014 [Sinapis alba]|nr:hypothetical protein N665_0179s0014 [Sinapis alba]
MITVFSYSLGCSTVSFIDGGSFAALAFGVGYFSEHKLFANLKKCSFCQSQVDYLGHIISQQEVATDPAKTASMQQWPTPKTAKQLRGFLGLMGYYRCLVKSYETLVEPLIELLYKDQFVGHLKLNVHLIHSKLPWLLHQYSFFLTSRSNVVEADASGVGLGVVLMQQKHHIAYYSHPLTPWEQLKLIYEHDLMHYLTGYHFVVHTNQKRLKFLLKQRDVFTEYQKWFIRLRGFEFDIIYKFGIKNKAVDSMSRQMASLEGGVCATLLSLVIPRSLNLQDIYAEIEQDEGLETIKKQF